MSNWWESSPVAEEKTDATPAANWWDEHPTEGDQGAPKKQNTSLIGDIGTGLKRGALQIPGMATGLGDIVSAPLAAASGVRKPISKAADWLGEKTGFQPGKWADEATAEYSPEMQQAIAHVDEAQGFFPALKAAVEKPRSIANLVAESLPSTLVGGVAARGAMGAVMGAERLAATRLAAAAGDKAAKASLLKAGSIAGGIGEGAVTAGQQMEQTDESVDPLRAAGAAIGSGIGTGIIGTAGGRLATKLGLPDVDTAFAAGTLGDGVQAGTTLAAKTANVGKRMAIGGVQEGVFEEMPQSAQEQVWQNVANGKPWDEGIGEAMAQGLIAGTAMGAGVNALPRGTAVEPEPNPQAEPIDGMIPQNPESAGLPDEQLLQTEAPASTETFEKTKLPPAGPLSAAVNAGIDSGATSLDPVAPTSPVLRERDFVPPPTGRFGQMNELANLIDSERQDVEGQRNALVQGQQLRRASELESTDARVESARIQQTNQQRDALLQNVLENLPEGQNPSRAFDRALRATGFADTAFRPEEVRTIQNWNNVIQSAQPETIPSAPNELDAEAIGIRSLDEKQKVIEANRRKFEETRKRIQAQRGGQNGTNAIAPTIPEVASPSLEVGRNQLPGSGSILASAPIGDTGSVLSRAEVAASGVRPAVPAGTASATGVTQSIQPQGLTNVASPTPDQAVESQTQRTEAQPAAAVAPEVKGYPLGRAKMLAGRRTHENRPTEIYPHPTQPGMYALRPIGENNARRSEPTNVQQPAEAQQATEQVAPIAAVQGAQEVAQIPARRPVKPKTAPIMRRDDLVGAIMRATGGRGIHSNMATTLVGDTANNATRLRGLFTNQGQQDMDDLAMLLREQEGFDVRDASHLEDLVREAASGNVAVSMERQERDKADAQEKQYRDTIRQKAKKFGIKTVAVKFSDVEKSVLARMEERHNQAVAELDERSQRRFNAALEDAMSAVPEAVVDETMAEVTRRGLSARDFWNETTRILRGMIYDARQEAANGTEATKEEVGDGRGNRTTGSGTAADQRDQAPSEQSAAAVESTQEERPDLALEGQTPAEVRAQEAQRQADEARANRPEQDASPRVKADQVDLFNTQGGLFNSNRDAPVAQVKEKTIAELQEEIRKSDPFSRIGSDLNGQLIKRVSEDAQQAIDSGIAPTYETGQGTFVVIHPSAQNEGMIQVTRYSDRGVFGDSQYNTMESAIRDNVLWMKTRMSQAEAEKALGQSLEAEAEYQRKRQEAEQQRVDTASAPVASTEQAQPQQTVRGEVGASLTKEQRKEVLKTLVDVYKANNAPKEFKGVDRNGNERSGYAHSPEFFVKSDITRAMVRYYVTLPDGRIAHPTELFSDYTQSDIDAALQKQISDEKNKKDFDAMRLESLNRRSAPSLNEANRLFWKANPGLSERVGDDFIPAILTDGSSFIRTRPDMVDDDLRLLGDGWTRQLTLPERIAANKQKKQAENAERAKKFADLVAKRKAEKAEQEVPEWHTKLPTQGLQIEPGDEKINGATKVVIRASNDAYDALTQTQLMSGVRYYAHYMRSKDGRHGIARLLPDDQDAPAGWTLLNGEGLPVSALSKEQIAQKLNGWLRSAPIIGEPVIERGTVGGKLASGQVVLTSSGRKTTPFPNVSTGTSRKNTATTKAVDQWLMQNALDEANARGDRFNAQQFDQNKDRPQQAEKDSAEEYLFGQQPDVVPSILRPMTAPDVSKNPEKLDTSAERVKETQKTDKEGLQAQEESSVYTVNEPDQITGDLFQGTENALPEAERADIHRARKAPGRNANNRQGSRAVLAVREATDAPGIYHVTTQLVTVGERNLPVSRINTPEDAARAFAQLTRFAVEHLDGIVTDKDGKPLAVIGALKGAPTQTSVYPSTVMMELARIDEAANLWVSHNHPSGRAELSPADEKIAGLFNNILRGSGITFHGVSAMARIGDTVYWEDSEERSGSVPYGEPAPHRVPIVEREIVANNPSAKLTSALVAKQQVIDIAKDQPGIVFLTAQHAVASFVPLNPEAIGQLRTDGRLMALFRAASRSGAVAAIVAMPDGKVAPFEYDNIGAALATIDVRVIDGIEYDSASDQPAKSLAERGAADLFGATFYSKGVDQVTTPMQQSAAESRVKALLGDKLGRVLIESGIVSFSNQGNQYDGATFSNGNIVLNLDALNDEKIAGVLAHEGFHSTVKELIGEETYSQLMEQLEKLTAANTPWANEAKAAVPKDTKAGDVTEEIAAYAVQQHVSGAKLSPFLKRWASSFLSALRTAIIRRLPFGKLKAWAVKNVQPEDLANLAIAGLKAKAQGRLQQGREAMAYSESKVGPAVPRTTSNDGVAQTSKTSGSQPDSTVTDTPSDGNTGKQPQTETAEFKRWFVDSAPLSSRSSLILARQSAMSERRPDGNASDAKSLSDLFVSKAFGLEALGGFDIPTQREMLNGVLSLGNDREVVRSVVKLIPVDVMNILKRENLSAESLFSNKPMLKKLLSADSDGSVATAVDVADALILGVARVAAKRSSVSAEPFTGSEEGNAAAGTGSFDEFHANSIAKIKTIGNNGDFDPSNPDIRYSKSAVIGDSGRNYNADQRTFFKNVGREIDRQNVIDRTLNYLKSDFWKKMAVGLVDQFRGLRDLNDGGQAYMLARLSKGTAGAFDALLHHGKLSLKDGAYDGDTSGGFIDRLGVPLHGELDDFLWWVAANRAEGLTAQGKENLFSPQDIQAGKSLAAGMTTFDYTIQTGPSQGTTTRNRQVIYQDAMRVFNGFQKNVLDMAEQSGLIDGASRQHWESDFYVPFYRVSEEDGEFVGAKMGNALVRQQAFKKLKGGTDKLNSDLLTNTLMNLSHLIEASAKNRAATAALTAAEKIGAARKAIHGEKHTVWHMDKGQKVEYKVEDPFVMTAITSLEYAGMRNGVMDAMTKFKHWLTIGVTASPAFKVRNLIRDSIQAIGTSDLSYNPIKNVTEGFKQTKRDSQAYVSALASGGLIRFGTMLEGSESNRVRQLIKSGVKDSSILNNEAKWRQFYDKYIEPAVSAYNELGNRSEEINRAALYNQLIKQGKSHAEAALLARDLMDFSMQGSFNTIRFLSQVTPFFNARLQGMYKLGRSAKDNPRKLAVVTGAVALASIALMAGYEDDEDWKRREDWDRDGFFWFKLGGIEYRIPKPFEVGAVASLAERSVEYLMNDEMTGERFRKVVGALAMNNLSMNPVPQMVKPIIDLYANKDSFTGRPIESMGMQRLESTMRYNSGTSMVARGLSTASLGALSPVQYDHLARAYFGWLGSFVVGCGDMLARAMSDEPTKPAPDLFKLSTQGLAKEAGTGSSRYLSMVYDQAEELEKVYATHRQLIKDRKLEEAKTYAEDNQEALGRYRQVEHVKKQETLLNARIRFIERSGATADEKKAQIDALNKRKEQVAMRIAPGLN